MAQTKTQSEDKKTTAKTVAQTPKPGIERMHDGTIKITMVLRWIDLKPTWDEVFDAFVKSAKVPGFREGKAPKNLVEGRINKASVREEVLRKELPKAYIKAVSDNNLKPIIDPRIHVHSQSGGELKEGEDWIFEAETAEAPKVSLGNYKDKVKGINAKAKIVVPGKETETPKFEDLMQAFLSEVKVNIPKVIVEREADRLLAQSLDEIKRLGLTLDQYLASTGRDAQAFRAEYEKKAADDLKLEFALQQLAQEEKITVTEDDIQKSIAGAKTEEEKRQMEANKYLIATILRQQKTLDFIRNL